MFRNVSCATPFLVLAALSISPVLAGDPFTPRQYYSGWQMAGQRQFAFRSYYYKPSPEYAGYKHHFVIRTPQDPQHLYFYNPYASKFWGRCPTAAAGRPQYSLLAEKDRKAKLEEIPPSAFPAPTGLPPIPESTDGAVLDLPPDDLPTIAGLPE